MKVRIRVICGDDLWEGEAGVVYMSGMEPLRGTQISHVYKSMVDDVVMVTLNEPPEALVMDKKSDVWVGRMSGEEYKVIWPVLFTSQDIENIHSVRAWVKDVK